ncbi:hypothetical protein LY78DRAFT_60746 [Colletotrichum sublineola]|nr:hypothetical protein LY78DRAFT_60746 [Colletotrichum sublineola]
MVSQRRRRPQSGIRGCSGSSLPPPKEEYMSTSCRWEVMRWSGRPRSFRSCLCRPFFLILVSRYEGCFSEYIYARRTEHDNNNKKTVSYRQAKVWRHLPSCLKSSILSGLWLSRLSLTSGYSAVSVRLGSYCRSPGTAPPFIRSSLVISIKPPLAQ